MSEPADTEGIPRAKPTERAWLDAKREVADRNERARKAGKEQRAAHERQIAALKRPEGDVYR